MTARSPGLRASRLAAAGIVAGGVLLLLTAVGGFLHTPAGRPLLLKLAGKSCPFERGKLEPARREELRRLGLSRMALSEQAAPSHTALGFELGSSTRADVRAWVTKHALACRAESADAGLACDDVPAALVGDTAGERGSLTFRFDPRERLVALLRIVRTADAERAATLATAAQTRLRVALGEPMRASGVLSSATLASGPLRQARAEYRFRDFSAFASVTSLDRTSYLITEEAQLAD